MRVDGKARLQKLPESKVDGSAPVPAPGAERGAPAGTPAVADGVDAPGQAQPLANAPAAQKRSALDIRLGNTPQPDAPVFRVTIGNAPGLEPTKRALIESMVRRSANATAQDLASVLGELSRVPTAVLTELAKFGYTFVVCHDSITEHLTHLKGQTPRGWPPGSTWDDCPGLHMPGGYQIVIAASGLQRRDRTVLHETGHALDYVTALKLRSSDDFRAARARDAAVLEPYFQGDTNGAREETFAESFANAVLGDRRWPALAAFWDRHMPQ